LEVLKSEEVLKVRQALPSFHAGQRELLFCNTPILVEGSTDAAVLLNVATKLELPLGAAGLGIAPMGGKYQLLAYRALLNSLAKPNARFVLDMDAAVTPQVLNCLDIDDRVVQHLAASGSGERTLSKVSGELISLLRAFCRNSVKKGHRLESVPLGGDGTLDDAELGFALRSIIEALSSEAPNFDANAARTIVGKFQLIRGAARAANVLILSKGSIEAYYEKRISVKSSAFAKQQAFKTELDAIWQTQDPSALRDRYGELLLYIQEAGLLEIPISDMAREPIANLVHLMQTEIRLGRVKSLDEAKNNVRAVAEGYWQICDLVSLTIDSETEFRGSIRMKAWLGSEEMSFDNNTPAYNLTVKQAR